MRGGNKRGQGKKEAATNRVMKEKRCKKNKNTTRRKGRERKGGGAERWEPRVR